ncbi:DUF2505 domain-containing protein [Nocardia huaxiensis]|uniref:DUF2505 domain-containing protein n=1 Tax=Nocardia huaxiensis TaxID=2755382 RepID=A0A7D6ZJ37_9NOCA|nr:DUF2505 domain-containing protein [Nocardia huaxiensis]QLY32239.1 DUF2505 domain-containing protein [Nocardia huaxiensis]UFS94056.1 DUF2505 domain-containing protein [Nocardia huaxiensis]
MATPLAFTAHSTHSMAAVRAAFANEQYWKDRIEAVGGPNARIDAISIDGDNVRVDMTQTIPASELPAQITAIKPEGLVIPRTETWHGQGGTVEAHVDGAPANVNGTLTVTDTGNGSTFVVDASIDVKIPLFGKKIEAAIQQHLTELLEREAEFTDNWLSSH